MDFPLQYVPIIQFIEAPQPQDSLLLLHHPALVLSLLQWDTQGILLVIRIFETAEVGHGIAQVHGDHLFGVG